MVALAALATSVVVFQVFVAVLGQGYDIGDPTAGIDIIFPSSIVQCEPVLIYYNNPGTDQVQVSLIAPGDYSVLTFYFPPRQWLLGLDLRHPCGLYIHRICI